jgi:transposase-like protein
VSGPEKKEPIRTRELVAELLADGFSVMHTARLLGLNKSTVCYHKRRLGHQIDAKFNRRYDWREVQRFYDAGHSITACQEHFGFARKTFYDAVKRGVVATRSQAAPIETYLVQGRPVGRDHLKGRLLAAGLKTNRCELCGICEWRDAPLSMALHHINGDRDDNRLENLMLLCPNCHAQTSNFAGRNRRIRRLQAALRSAGASRFSSADARQLQVLGEAA